MRISGLWLALVAVLLAGAARAEPRVALIIGNGGYQAVSTLDNTVADASLIAETLSGLGFDVTLLQDASLAEMRRGFATFGQKLREAGPQATGLFYYAGHGAQSFGSNYLVPVDARLAVAADLDLVAIDAQSVLRQMASARNRTNIVILDACRNNPFSAVAEMNDKGLAEMKAPTGTFLAYATEPGAVALDGTGGHSPFTEALAALLPQPGLPIEQLFKQVRVKVLEQTAGLQTPWDTSSLTADFAFAAPGGASVGEERLWTAVRSSSDPVEIMLFLRSYPDGAHAEEARALLAARMAAELNPGQSAAPAAAAAVQAPVAPAAKAPDLPDPAEEADFAAAQAAGSVETWESFLAKHPKSVFREIAETELAAMAGQSGADPTPQPAEPDFGEIRFDRPLTAGGENVIGRTMAEIIAGSPLYPPIQGLPAEVWSGKACETCHQWTPDALCEQGKFYAKAAEPILLGDVHPLGGQFRRVLKTWADQGCP